MNRHISSDFAIDHQITTQAEIRQNQGSIELRLTAHANTKQMKEKQLIRTRQFDRFIHINK